MFSKGFNTYLAIGVILVYFSYLTNPCTGAPPFRRKSDKFRKQSAQSTQAKILQSNKNLDILQRSDQEIIAKDEPLNGEFNNPTNLANELMKSALTEKGLANVVKLMNTVNNIFNANTNIDSVDRLMTAFNDLFNSRGVVNLNNYFFSIANFWVIYDATAMIVRAIESRNVGRVEDKKADIKQEEINSVVEETIDTLNEANARLIRFQNNLKTLICLNFPQVNRNGLVILKRQGHDRQIDCSTFLSRLDKHKESEEM